MSTHRIRQSQKQRGRKRAMKSAQDNLTEALGASTSFPVSHRPHGPFGVAALLDEIKTRLISRGGRPSEKGPTIRRLVPIRKQVWRTLKAEADFLSARGRRISPAQLAAMLVEKSLSELTVQRSAQTHQTD